MAIGLSHGGTNIYASERRSDEVHVGTMEGIVTLGRTASGDWEEVRHSLPGKHIHAIIFVGDTMFAGVYRDTVYASADQGLTWEKRDTGIDVASVYSLAAQLVNGRPRLYAGTEPPHLFSSDDMGASWAELPGLREIESVSTWRFAADPFEGHVKHINFDPRDPDHIYVSVEVGGLMESFDGGETWSQWATPNPDVHRTLIDPANAAGVYTTGGAGILWSDDRASEWNVLLERHSPVGGYPDLMVHVPSDPKVMYVSSSQYGPREWYVEAPRTAGGRIARSGDGGETWQVLQGGLPDRLRGAAEAMCLEEAEGEVSLFAGMIDGEIWHSDDAGANWRKIADLPPVSKSIHWEMLTGTRRTALKFNDGVLIPAVPGA